MISCGISDTLIPAEYRQARGLYGAPKNPQGEDNMLQKGSISAGACIAIALMIASCACAAAVNMSIADTTAARGDTLWMPVWSTDITDSNVYSYQFIMSFDSTFVEILDVTDDGGITDVGPWMAPSWHIREGEDSLRVASAGTEPLSGEGLFVTIGIRVLDVAPTDSSAFLGLHDCIMNEGVPAVLPDGGWLFIATAGVAHLPEDGSGPVRIERLTPTTIRWELANVDTHGASLEIYDAFGRFVTRVEPMVSDDAVAFTWTAKNSEGAAVSGGVYFYRLSTRSDQWSGKVCVLR